MTINAQNGPIIVNFDNPLGSVGSGSANQNPQAAPNMLGMGFGILDPRQPFTYYPGMNTDEKLYGFLTSDFLVCSAVPSAISAVNIAATQSGAAALTLVAASGAGITVGAAITRADTGAAVTGLLAIDTAMAGYGFGQDAMVNLWDPSKAIARNVRITSAGNDSAKTILVTGYDIYGYPMSELITGANAGVASGVKAFKYIASVVFSAVPAGNVSVGTGDVFGLGLRSDYFGELEVNWNNAWITANTGYTAAVTTSPATTTTGDVRGTYAVQSASDATKRLFIYQRPGFANLPSITGMFGVAQNLANNNGS